MTTCGFSRITVSRFSREMTARVVPSSTFVAVAVRDPDGTLVEIVAKVS